MSYGSLDLRTDAEATAILPFETHMLDVGGGHRIYVERVGRPDGIPAIFLHGGPGSGCNAPHRELFDPNRYCATLFDQRGAGRSTPWLGLKDNTTDHLTADIERIRKLFGHERMLVVGGSWGSTLALAYAQRHPERVAGIVMRAIFLGTPREVEWAFIDGPRTFRPELYAQFLAWLPERERADPLSSYYKRLLDPEPQIHVPAAWVWHHYERALSELHPQRTTLPADIRTTGKPPPTAIMEAHYLTHDCFLGPDQLIADAGRLAGIPGVIIQSRYDLLCPPVSARRLHEAWPGSKLTFIEPAGHAMSEPGVKAAMIAAIEQIGGRP